MSHMTNHDKTKGSVSITQDSFSLILQLGSLLQLQGIYDRLVEDGLETTAVTYSCLIRFAAEAGMGSKLARVDGSRKGSLKRIIYLEIFTYLKFKSLKVNFWYFYFWCSGNKGSKKGFQEIQSDSPWVNRCRGGRLHPSEVLLRAAELEGLWHGAIKEKHWRVDIILAERWVLDWFTFTWFGFDLLENCIHLSPLCCWGFWAWKVTISIRFISIVLRKLSSLTTPSIRMKLRVAEGSWQKDLGKVDRNKLYCNIGGLDVCPTFLLALAQRTGLGSNGKSICKLDLMHDSKANQHIYRRQFPSCLQSVGKCCFFSPFGKRATFQKLCSTLGPKTIEVSVWSWDFCRKTGPKIDSSLNLFSDQSMAYQAIEVSHPHMAGIRAREMHRQATFMGCGFGLNNGWFGRWIRR